jgi:hypothetical protein
VREAMDGGDTLDEILDSRVAKKLWGGFEDNDIGKPARRDGATNVVRRIHPDRFNIHLAQFGADRRAHCPTAAMTKTTGITFTGACLFARLLSPIRLFAGHFRRSMAGSGPGCI